VSHPSINLVGVSWVRPDGYFETNSPHKFVNGHIVTTNPVIGPGPHIITKIDETKFTMIGITMPLSNNDSFIMSIPEIIITTNWIIGNGIFTLQNHNLLVDDLITIESDNLDIKTISSNIQYIPSITLFKVDTIPTPDTFTVANMIQTCIESNSYVLMAVQSRIIHIDFTCYCQDKKTNVLSSNRAILTT